MGLFDVFHIPQDFGGITVLAHPIDPGVSFPADYNAAAEQFLPRGLVNGVAFPGKEAFIHLAVSFQQHTIRSDLLACLQHHNVVQHQFFHGKLDQGAVPKDMGFGGGNQAEPVHRALGPDLLENADGSVAENDSHKQYVFVGTHCNDQHRQDHVD